MNVTDMTPKQLDDAVIADTNKAMAASVGLYAGMEVRHVKTGGHYVVLCEATIEATMVKAVVYKAVRDGTTWVRPVSEFCDGRFVGV